MKYLLILPLLVLSVLVLKPQLSYAHSAAIATYIIEQQEKDKWILTISVPLGGVHQALVKHYSERDLWTTGHKYNVPLVQKYLVDHSKILVNKNLAVEFEAISYMLDDHQSNFVFALKNIPKNAAHFRFAINAMAENEGHINIVRVLKNEVIKKTVLQAFNQYSGEINLVDTPTVNTVAAPVSAMHVANKQHL